MSVLLIDAGNSRLKWAWLRGPYVRGMRFARRGVLAPGEDPGAWLGTLARRSRIERIHVANVAGERVAAQLRAAARAAGLPAPRFARTGRRHGAVRNAYAQPWRLGVDRWLALIGAQAEYPRRTLCIVSVGTATTIDLLDSRGRHRGGAIAPAPPLMIEALLAGTAGIRRRAGRSAGAGRGAPTRARRPQGLFARDTRAALAAGAGHATAALIERALAEARRQLRLRPRLLLGGGGAANVTALLACAFERRDDLVLRGLAVVAAGAGDAG